jgi:hypothetical protein
MGLIYAGHRRNGCEALARLISDTESMANQEHGKR